MRHLLSKRSSRSAAYVENKQVGKVMQCDCRTNRHKATTKICEIRVKTNLVFKVLMHLVLQLWFHELFARVEEILKQQQNYAGTHFEKNPKRI